MELCLLIPRQVQNYFDWLDMFLHAKYWLWGTEQDET